MSRLGLSIVHRFRQYFGTRAKRRLSKAALQIDAIRHWESVYEKLSEAEIKSISRSTSCKGILRTRARAARPLCSRIWKQNTGRLPIAKMLCVSHSISKKARQSRKTKRLSTIEFSSRRLRQIKACSTTCCNDLKRTMSCWRDVPTTFQLSITRLFLTFRSGRRACEP